MKTFIYQNQKLNYVDQGRGETIVFVHGTPTSSSEYEQVIAELSKDYRCLALDHLGFGLSDKPENGDYTISAHQKRLESWLQHLQIKQLHLFVHDFGGVIGLPLLQKSDLQIKSVTLANTWLWPLIETEPQMQSQKALVTSGVFPFLYRHFNFSAKVLLKMAWGKRRPLSRQRHRFYRNHFPNRKSREGTVGFLKSLFDFTNPCWQQPSVLQTLKNKPVQFIWGEADKLISSRNLQRWHESLPESKIYKLHDVGHFVAEEAPEDVIEKLKQFIDQNK
ncbi:alpha/beta fold hydrolase [Pseudobdellovibrio exovorus]|uniref:AB hydrolase-1 domain-containing protein n=1 Tax=Pseudobdellovibrio exovorus JSS TaxID=1184267 RepID=M4V4Y7_9BACT|nr:alpha/beta hydrolase [Pseudobdellovibrio exovorus]AGH94243.1 hypothetical protein A11Q_23 [Pseudobdellovibrio exovorus JSS]